MYLFLHHYWIILLVLLKAPFMHMSMVWGIVPLYFGWIINELTSRKASFSTAIQTGFSFLWAGAHWSYLYFHRGSDALALTVNNHLVVNVIVTILVLIVGLIALISGIRHHFPKYGVCLGHTRFSNYFMITIFAIQSNYLRWNWDRLFAILLFAIPLWVAIYLVVLLLSGISGRER